MKHYAIVGRVHGWDEDEVCICEADDRNAAIAIAREEFWEMDGASPHYREMATQNGEGVYINHIVSSDSPIELG